MDPVRILLSGATGRMGRAVAELATLDPAFRVIGGLDRVTHDEPLPGVPRVADASAFAELVSQADVIIDFSAPDFLAELLTGFADGVPRVALVVGTTGLGPDVERLLEVESLRRPVLRAANFSVGVNLLLSLVAIAARALGDDWDVEIVEAHHRRKEDAPSGTAIALGEAAAAGRSRALGDVRRDCRTGRPGVRPPGEIGFHAVRGGEVVGDHHVHFIGERERIEITHRASDRSLFAAGALRAAGWIAGRPAGHYTMTDVLGLERGL